jgi:hypothetical protein
VSPIESSTSAIATAATSCENTGRRIPSGNVAGTPARVRIRAVLHPAVGFAFADRAGLLQNGDGPVAQRLDRRSSLLRHQHRHKAGFQNRCGCCFFTCSAAMRRANDVVSSGLRGELSAEGSQSLARDFREPFERTFSA